MKVLERMEEDKHAKQNIMHLWHFDFLLKQIEHHQVSAFRFFLKTVERKRFITLVLFCSLAKLTSQVIKAKLLLSSLVANQTFQNK